MLLSLLCAALCLLASPARAATNDLTTALQRGLFEEEANQNLGAAIQAYQTVANQFDKDRKLAATAIFRLGECYRKQGNTNDAATQYERILRDFSDQPTLVTLSRQNLAALGSAPLAPSAPVISDAARQEQKRLLDEEIKLVQKQLDMQQKQVENGIIAPGELVTTQRDLLKLKRQVAAIDGGLPVSITATEAAAPAASSEADEVRRIQALIKDSPDLINAPDQKGETLLQAAAAKGKLAVVKVLLENGAAVDGLQQPGLTPLHYAAANGHKAAVDLLLSKGAKADAQTETGVTPLHLAARKGYETVAKALLAAGVPVNAATRDKSSFDTPDLQYSIGSGQTPLHLAANAGYSGIVELLLAKGAEANTGDGDGRTPLSYAAQKHYLAILQALLAAHANPNGGRFNLPLATAAYAGDMPALKLLLDNGADPNTNSTVNWQFGTRSGYFNPGTKGTPLFLAISQRKADAAKELLRCKANPNLPGPNENPLLYEALSDAPTLKVLLEGGADPNAKMPNGAPMLMQAVWDKNQPAVELLLAYHAEVNFTVQSGWTPLQAAAANGLKPIAELLLKAGAAVNAKGWNGETPLYEAVRSGHPELAELLLANKADPNAKNNNGWTPLHQAVSDNQLVNQVEIVKLLLAHKADPNERNNTGQTPLDLAKSQGPSAPGRPPGGLPGYPVPGPGGISGMSVNPAPSLAYQWQTPGTPPAATPAKDANPETMADLLRQHGAADDLPRLDWIEVRRNAIRVNTPFTKGTHDWSQFTLLELIAVECDFLTRSPDDGGGDSYAASAFFSKFRALPFSDFARLHVRRPAGDLKNWKDQVVDLRPVLEAGDCSKDVHLEWGDVVDIPEADHPLNEKWPGFSTVELANLKKCLTRQVEIVISGQATNITLAPRISNVGEEKEAATAAAAANPGSFAALNRAHQEPVIDARTPFWLKPVLLQSKLVLTSSDLRHVKVTRRDTTSGQEHVWVVDCSQANSSPDLWLRDGDKIEVPEKTDSASAN
jgi:cytohesin